jgi:hypothetical protein
MNPRLGLGWLRATLAVVAWGVAVLATPLAGQERILSYQSEIRILADGTLEVEESIRVRAEGNQIRRGLYRDFPTQYRDRLGNRVRVDFEVLSLERDGRPEPWFTESISRGVRVAFGSDELLPFPLTLTYTLRYRTSQQIGFFSAHDELYWNAIGTGWTLPVEASTVRVLLPEPVPPDSLRVEGYTGPQGARGRDYRAVVPAPGEGRFELSAPLAPGEGFTVVLSFPKGVVVEPTLLQRGLRLLGQNLSLLFGLLVLLGLTLRALLRRRAVATRPPPGVVIPRYIPPSWITPGGARLLRSGRYDPRCFSADLLTLAVGGVLRLETEPPSKRGRTAVWKIRRATLPLAAAPEGSGEGPAASGRVLLESLFPGGGREEEVLALTNREAERLQGALSAHAKVLNQHLDTGYLNRNIPEFRRFLVLTLGLGGLALLLSGGLLPKLILGSLLLALVLAFHRWVRVPTAEGQKGLDEIEGLKLYLTVAERDTLASLGVPQAEGAPDLERYESLLPWAVALEVEDAWTGCFMRAVGSEVATQELQRRPWLSGVTTSEGVRGLGTALGKGLASGVASASTPPGSRSGSGGGGSSGGGGGGGGGGGR